MAELSRTIHVEIDLDLYEPSGPDENGVTRFPMFLMFGGGEYTLPGTENSEKPERHGFGQAGASFVAYLPGERAIGIDARKLVQAGLKAIDFKMPEEEDKGD